MSCSVPGEKNERDPFHAKRKFSTKLEDLDYLPADFCQQYLRVCFLELLSENVDVARWLECRNSNPKTGFVLGSTPSLGRVRSSFFLFPLPPPIQLLCKLVCAWPTCVCTAHSQICVRVKDPVSICRKKSRPQSRWLGHTTILHALGGE